MAGLGGVTKTVDPMHTQQWIFEIGGELPGHGHKVAKHVGLEYDRRDVEHLRSVAMKHDAHVAGPSSAIIG